MLHRRGCVERTGIDVSLVEVERDDTLAVVRLVRPEKLNALSSAMETDLLAVLSSPQVSTSAAVVLTGSGRAFSAGADVDEMRDMDRDAILAYYRGSGRVYEAVAALPQPTVSAVHGYCLGGGFELALATDFRVADETAQFGCPEIGLGIVPGSGGILRLVRAVGPARARELILLGRRIDAATAHHLGLVTEVVPGAAADRARSLAREVAALPGAAVAVAKRAIDVVAESSAAAALLVEQLAYAALNSTAGSAAGPDSQRGVSS